MLEIGSSETRLNLVDLLSNRLVKGAEVSNQKSSRREPLPKEGNTRFQDALNQQGHAKAQAVRNERSETRHGASISEAARQTRNIGNKQAVASGNERKTADQNSRYMRGHEKTGSGNGRKSAGPLSERLEEATPVQETEDTLSRTEQAGEASEQMVLATTLIEEVAPVMDDMQSEEVVIDSMTQPKQVAENAGPVTAVVEKIDGAEEAPVKQALPLPPAILEKLETALREAGITAEMLETIRPESVPIEAEALIQWLKAEGEGLRSRLMEAGVNQTAVDPEKDVLSTSLFNASAVSDNGAEWNDDEAASAPRPELVETVPLKENTVSFQQVAGTAGEESDGTRHAVSGGAGVSETVAPQQDKPVQAASTGNRPTFASVREQFSAHLQRMQAEGKNEMQLQLKPDHLGRLHLKVVEEKGHVLAKFTAESEQVRAILESNMQLLKDALEKNGVTVTALEVSVGQREGQESNTDGATGRKQFGYANGIRNGSTSMTSPQVVSERLRQWLDGPTATVSFKA